MHRFTTKDIEKLCGIKAVTLRAWERRYGLFNFHRKESGHRQFDLEDLKMILRVVTLYQGGWKPSKIATLTSTEIKEAIEILEEKLADDEQYILLLLEAAITLQESKASRLLDDLIHKTGLEHTLTKVGFPYLSRLELVRNSSQLLSAQGHFSGNLIRHKIIAETEKLPPALSSDPAVLIFSPRGGQDEVRLLYINYLLKKGQWQTTYLGAPVSLGAIKASNVGEAGYLYVHLGSTAPFETDDYLEQVCRAFPGKTIAASGEGILAAQRQFVNLLLLKSDREIYSFIQHKPSLATRTVSHRQG